MTSIVASQVRIPPYKAILWDMDGVLIDSLGLAYGVVNELLDATGIEFRTLEREDIRAAFPLSPDDFWRQLLGVARVNYDECLHNSLVADYEKLRRSKPYPLNPCILDFLGGGREAGIRQAVVSNTPKADLIIILKNAGIDTFFDAVVGNDEGALKKKPEPDCYIHAAKLLNIEPSDCVVFEDSILGATAGRAAGCFTIGVATGASTFEELSSSGTTDAACVDLSVPKVRLEEGSVQSKRISTPNDFVSHMIEHIAWRTGSTVDIVWGSDDWEFLGMKIGKCLASRIRDRRAVAALGMIDDGSAEVVINWEDAPGFSIETVPSLNREFILQCRVEQLNEPTPLLLLASGIGKGLNARIIGRIWSFEDPHHTWEGLFRAIGIGLSKAISSPGEVKSTIAQGVDQKALDASPIPQDSGISVVASICSARATRITAESNASVEISISEVPEISVDIQTNDTINVRDLSRLLEQMAISAGLSLALKFEATRLSSSHVVLEDTGIVIGRALSALAVKRMMGCGINGAGSNVRQPSDMNEDTVGVGLSIEGRKFLKFCPADMPYEKFREDWLIGKNVFDNLRTEDLDDFLDGFTTGLGASAIVHVRRMGDVTATWQQIFVGLGMSIKESLSSNSSRKGVPPGVKATLI